MRGRINFIIVCTTLAITIVASPRFQELFRDGFYYWLPMLCGSVIYRRLRRSRFLRKELISLPVVVLSSLGILQAETWCFGYAPGQTWFYGLLIGLGTFFGEWVLTALRAEQHLHRDYEWPPYDQGLYVIVGWLGLVCANVLFAGTRHWSISFSLLLVMILYACAKDMLAGFLWRKVYMHTHN